MKAQAHSQTQEWDGAGRNRLAPADPARELPL